MQPIQHPAVPSPKSGSAFSASNPIDAFILDRLGKNGLTPSHEADRRTLARRSSYDLTGLPPDPEVLETFVQNPAPDAWTRWVDHLLASPAHGEHQARLWMDVIRYSDSNGYDWDEFRPNAWRFRDYLVRSFNQDKPLDQLVVEHLAGDELLAGPPNDPREQDWLVATGYLRLGPQDNSSALFNEQARSRSEQLADLVETTSSAFLGLSMACCRCHDHKFDPLSQEDHYRLRAFFEPTQYADTTPIDLAADQDQLRKNNSQVEQQLKPLDLERSGLLDQARSLLLAKRTAALSASDQALLASARSSTDTNTQAKAEALLKTLKPNDAEVIQSFDPATRQRHADLTARVEALNRQKMKPTLGLLMTDAAGPAPVTRVLFQGDHKQERQAVEPGVPSLLDPSPARIEKPTNPRTTGRRLALARWIVGRGNPLTARVLANRVWQNLFGRGLVETSNDFGLAGARPTHPDLLDWLATELMNQGWSLKQLERQIVLSATYRMASNTRQGESTDNGNTLLWRQNPRRLTAEQLRDSLLQVSGQLRQSSGGPPAWPELPPEVLQANPAFLDDNETRTKGWYPSPASAQAVRSIYLVQKRTVRVPFMETFDLPDNATSCSRRTASTAAPQALTLFNGTFAVEAAAALARKIELSAGADEQSRIRVAFQWVLQRQPTPEEAETCRRLLTRQGLVALSRVLLNANELIYLD